MAGVYLVYFFFNDQAHTEIYTYCHTLSLNDALPISRLISDSGARLVYGRSATTTPATPAMSDSRYESEWARQRHRVEYSVIQCGMPSASADRKSTRLNSSH